MPTMTAEITAHGSSAPVATDKNAPVTRRTSPGTAWWTWSPDFETLSLNGPRPARMLRVMILVTMNVTTNAAKHRKSARRFLAMIVSWNQVPTETSGYVPERPRGGRDGTVRHGRVRGRGARRPHHDGPPREAQRAQRRHARRARRGVRRGRARSRRARGGAGRQRPVVLLRLRPRRQPLRHA